MVKWIYGLREIGSSDIRYVGRGLPHKAIVRHKRLARQQRGSAPVHGWIRDVWSRNSEIEYVILQEVTDENVFDAERAVIASYRQIGLLLNVQSGGVGGHNGHQMTMQWRDRIRQSKLGLSPTLEHRQAVSEGLRRTAGDPQSCVQCRRMFKNNRAFMTHCQWKHSR